MRDYGKVFSRIWESEDFRSLSEDGRTLVLYLLTCKHATIAGVFRLPDGYACEDLQWSPERVREGFANASTKGFATRDEPTKWVWIAKFLEWNPPENPNQKKAAAKIALSVPEQCVWKSDFLSVATRSLGLDDDDGCGTLPKGLPNQKQKQKQKQDKKTGDSPAGFDTFWAAYPSKVGKGAALKAFEKVNPSQDLLTDMLRALADQVRSVKWQKNGGEFIPNPATWLNQQRWLDEGSGEPRGGGLNLVGAI